MSDRTAAGWMHVDHPEPEPRLCDYHRETTRKVDNQRAAQFARQCPRCLGIPERRGIPRDMKLDVDREAS